MSRRTILALSAALSAFVLVVIGAVASQGLRPRPPAPVAASAGAADSVPVDLVRAREAEFRRMIDTANARLRAQPSTAAAAPAELGGRDGTASRAFEPGDDDEGPDEHRTSARPEHRHEHHEHHEDDDG